MASKVSLVNEEGKTIERLVPNISAIKRVILIPMDYKGKDPEIQWLTFALPDILGSDLEQDSRLISIGSKTLSAEYDE